MNDKRAVDSDIDALKSAGAIAGNPYEVQITREALQQRLDSGEITRQDLDALKRASTWVPLLSGIGALSAIPVYWALGRRPPPLRPPFSLRLGLAMTTGVMNTFIGFTFAPLMAGLEIKRKVEDAPRLTNRSKLRVLSEVAWDAHRAIAEHRTGIPDGTVVMHMAGVPSPSRYFPPGTSTKFGPEDGVSLSELLKKGELSFEAEKDALDRQRKVFEKFTESK